MNNLVSDVSLHALLEVCPHRKEFETAVLNDEPVASGPPEKYRRWMPVQQWDSIVTQGLALEYLTPDLFFAAGLECASMQLLGPASYLPLFLGSPALVFHNIDHLIGSIDQCFDVRGIFVGVSGCRFELNAREPFSASTHYIEFLRGFSCAVASMWNCEIRKSQLVEINPGKRFLIEMEWSIDELHNRRALEELLVEREFYTEMFEGLSRISDSREGQFEDLLKNSSMSREKTQSSVDSNFSNTRLYDGQISFDQNLQIVSISSESLEMLEYESEAEMRSAIPTLKELLSEKTLSILLGPYESTVLYSVSTASGNKLELSLQLLDYYATDGEDRTLILRDADLAHKLNLSLEPTRHILDTLFTNNPSAIQIVDDRGWTLRVNRQFEQLFKVDAENCVGVGKYNILEDRRVQKSGIAAIIERALMGWERSTKTISFADAVYRDSLLLRNVKDTLVLEVSAFPLIKTSTRPTSVIITYTDITDAFITQQQLAQTEKLRSIGTLTSGIAHDFNNILGAIVPNADFIMSMSQEGDTIHRKAKAIKTASKRASELMKQLMTYARASKQAKSVVPLNSSVREAVELISNAVPRNISLNLEAEVGVDLKVMADPLQLHQVLINLIINAADAQPQGGEIVVRTKVYRVQHRISFGGNIITHGSFARIDVEDQGSGMPHEVVERIFDPFFTTKDKGRGTGLGLSVVHGIVKNHQGFIDVQSEEKKGTTVSVFFPIAESEVVLP